MNDVLDYIEQNSTKQFQAQMIDMPLSEYDKLPVSEAREQLGMAISRMNEERYSEYLLELIDE
jgi:hypothetical protein